MSDRPNILLVHGAFHGGWCWRRVVDSLHDRGARVFAPSLTGLGDRAHLLTPDIDLSVHLADIANLILWEDLHDVVLCGHSYAGMVISGVAEQLPDRIRSLVYLDALMPEPGACLWDYMPPSAREEFDRATEDGLIAPKSAEAFKVNPTDRDWVDAKCTPQPRATFLERLPQTNRRSAISRTYVFATGYATPMLSRFAAAARSNPHWNLVELPHGHNLMIDAPEAVAETLMAAAIA